jgi:DNA-directed RNA polymerase subunit RPC12/RpoP
MYKCSYCDKEFPLKQQKTNHEKYHTNIKRNKIKEEYCCSICGKKFKNHGQGKNHEKHCDGSGLTKKEKQVLVKQALYVPQGGKYMKGKTFIEVYGPKRAKEIGNTLSTSLKKIHGSPLTDEGRKLKREKITSALNKKYASGWDSKCGRAKKYDYESPIAGKIKVDGTWELKTAIYLDTLGIKWERNNKRFSYINLNKIASTYKPDFYIYDWNTYLEIKGYETDLDKCKWRQFKEPLIIWKKEDLIRLKII